MNKEREIFIRFLEKSGLKATAQRATVLDIFLKTEKHVSADDLFSLVKKTNTEIGHATVHRTLKLIKAAGLAREVDFGEGKKRYEHLFGHKHHDHLVCLKCGKTIEVLDPKIEKLQANLASGHGFKVSHHRLEILGICKSCQ
ncbi:transcriptional repressor [Candidatus Saganbacteria bacterium]|nr:transcriptional repressor [Candidatus Saganbacteria bacterium]